MERRTWLLLACSLAATCGCNKGPTIAVYPVSGTVSYKDKPVEGAVVAYIGGDNAPRVTGITNAEGHFSLTTYVSAKEVLKGAPPGEYRVAIIKAPVADAPTTKGDVMQMSNEERQKMMANMGRSQVKDAPKPGETTRPSGPPPTPKSEIPEKYAKPETSGQTATVVSGQNDPVEFKLSD